jgi:D-alanyl-lipoteichoic acid acyltransferase DltB (MBOAT superfamily)
MFFPQLVAGPIERPQHLLPQLNLAHEFDVHKARRGIERILWGFFKKLVIADQIGVIINPMFLNLPSDGPSLIVLMALFTYQLYCDFSGYSDIAIGAAMVLGIELTENFNRPFSSTSVAQFWRRWHISLSNWLRDYLYYPLALGWGKISRLRLYSSLFITFVLIGLWHGANWTFVVMGALHGFYLVFGSLTEKIRRRLADFIGLNRLPRLRQVMQVLMVFVLVSVSFIFFRSESLSQAWYIVSHSSANLVDIFNYDYIRHSLFRGSGLWKGKLIILVFLSIVFMELMQYYREKTGKFSILDDNAKWLRYSWYYALVLIILCFGYVGSQTFIYFQF